MDHITLIFPLSYTSYFIHRLGGFFIRRKLDTGSKRDELYRECLQEYIEQLLKANQNIEVYIGKYVNLHKSVFHFTFSTVLYI